MIIRIVDVLFIKGLICWRVMLLLLLLLHTVTKGDMRLETKQFPSSVARDLVYARASVRWDKATERCPVISCSVEKLRRLACIMLKTVF